MWRSSFAGDPVCVFGLTEICVVFCKAGNDAPNYHFNAGRGVETGPDINLRAPCSDNMWVKGLEESSIVWNAVDPAIVGYNDSLSCSSLCDSSIASFDTDPGVSYIDYAVSGFATGCSAGTITDTVRVNFFTPLTTTITPAQPAICFVGDEVELTATVNGGSTPYTYLWSNGSTNTTATAVAAGTFSVSVFDATDCDPAVSVVTVSEYAAIIATAGANTTVCSGDGSISLTGAVSETGTGIWSSDGDGTFGDVNNLNTVYNISDNDTSGSVTITLTPTNTLGCPATNGNMTVSFDPLPFALAGNDTTVCANIEPGFVPVASCWNCTTWNWSTAAIGTFNDATLQAPIFDPADADTTAGSVVLSATVNGNATCATYTHSDPLTLSFSPAPFVEAGDNITVCANNSDAILDANFTVASSAVWTSTGDGTFDDDNSITATYTPSDADTGTGTITLTLTTLPYGSCSPSSDVMSVIIDDAPVLNAGNDTSVCGNNANVSLLASIQNVTATYQWSTSGDGTFTAPNNLNSDYLPSNGDTALGIITLNISTTAQGICNSVNDNKVVTITNAPYVYAGNDTTICANNANIVLDASANSIGTSWQWSSSSGSPNFGNEFSINTTYIASDTDTTNGVVNLSITSTAQGGCNPVSDFLVATITDAPTISAGPNVTVCGNNANVTLTGSMTDATAAIWTNGGGDGTFDDATKLDAVYTPGSGDITLGTVVLTLSSTSQGDCAPVSSFMTIAITPPPVVSAGGGQSVCANNAAVSLTGTSNAIATAWQCTSSGNGTFDDENALVTIYHPSDDDTASAAPGDPAFITLTLSSTAQGSCLPTTNSMIVTITNAPDVNANNGQTVCANNSDVTLNGQSNSAATAWQWSTSATGGNFDNATLLNTVYHPSDDDTLAGIIVLTLTSTVHGSCIADTDIINITITDAPYIYPVTNVTVCANNADASLLATTNSVTATYQWSTVTGDGTFSSPNTLGTTYTAGDADTTSGSVIVNISTTAQGNCNSVNQDVSVIITDAPYLDAGLGQSVCGSNPNVTVTGTHNGVPTAWQWTSSGTGTFDDEFALSTVYRPSDADTASIPANGPALITLTLSSTAQGTCNSSSDIVIITITDSPTLDAGNGVTVCANNADISFRKFYP